METNCMGCYRIDHPEGSRDILVYRGKIQVMHLLSSREETEQEIVKGVREVIRILDL